MTLKDFFKKYQFILSIMGVAIVFYLVWGYYGNRFTRRGAEYMSQNANPAYKNTNSQNMGVRPSEPLGQNEVFASANGIQTSVQGMPSSCSKPNIQNPSELLPKDSNSQWAQLNPSGKGELSNINLLKAGYHIGIDTIGQTLRNANLQIRSEPPHPQLNVGPWNQSTIESDFMRPPLELGQGIQ